MTPILDSTHDPKLKSWVESANHPETDFPLQNLPYGIFRRSGSLDGPRVGVAIGDFVLDIAGCQGDGVFRKEASAAAKACAASSLNQLMALGQMHWKALRRELHDLLLEDGSGGNTQGGLRKHLLPRSEAQLLMPVEIGDYTDFYASIYHATNVGRMFRPDNPLLPNYKYVPIAYHGRASSIVLSGSGVQRPPGQTHPDASAPPQFGPSRQVDYELEVGFFVGTGNALGQPIAIESTADNIFGLCLLNDWSARDIQTWEYQPLGPFLAKNFATTISPWVVTLDALAPFRVAAFERPVGDPQPLPYLLSAEDQNYGGIDLTLEVFLRTPKMKQQGMAPFRLSRGNFSDMYWTIAQMLTHHASNGCNLRTGDLLASGTVSGSSSAALGCLLELTKRGANAIALPSGEERRFLEDGDEVILRGYCEREGFARVGLGECAGTLVAGYR
jgi:fumarylacetoacetase